MKIAVIAHDHFPIRVPYLGGLEAHTYQMVNQLVDEGHDVTLYCKFGSNTHAKQVYFTAGKRLKVLQKFYDTAYNSVMVAIKSLRYDLIINNSLHHNPLLKHTLDMPPMLTIFHTPPLPEMIDALQASQRRINRSYIAVSEYTANQWSPHCYDKVRAVSNGIDVDNWTSQTSVHDQATLAWVGRITPEKGTHLAIEAAIHLGMPITVGGSVYDKVYFKNVIKPLLKNPLVTYAGHVNKSKVNEIYSKASVALITPQWDEPFGLVALEALISGTPVAAYARGGLTSIINSKVGTLARHNTVKSLAKAVKKAIKKDRKVCAAYAKLNYSMNAMVDNYMNIAYEHVTMPVPEDVAIQGARFV